MAIFNNSINTTDKTNQYFCLTGTEDFVDDLGFPRTNNPESDNIVAKIVFSKRPKHFSDQNKIFGRHYIKIDPNDKIFNPKKILSSIAEKDSLSFIKNICKNGWNFKEVTPQVFQKYIMFLKTKQLAWLKEAQRDLM